MTSQSGLEGGQEEGSEVHSCNVGGVFTKGSEAGMGVGCDNCDMCADGAVLGVLGGGSCVKGRVGECNFKGVRIGACSVFGETGVGVGVTEIVINESNV